ncbi:hypothetical protein ACGF5S_32775 [Nocardia nova]|uniref:hypothetical protein n=1 Tax=Nocardia nova TaxID=37330 RepID=UPI003723F893
MKNIRPWIFASTAELYQLLDKAAQLQRAQPTALILPVLVCRRANHTMFFMARELGFKILPTQRQYIRGVNAEHLQQVRNELGFYDLTDRDPDDPDPFLVKNFCNQIPKDAADYCRRWRDTVLTYELDEYFTPLRDKSLRFADREAVLDEFKASAARIERDVRQGGW